MSASRVASATESSRPQRCGRVRLHVFDQFFDVSARRTPHANLGEIPDALNGFDVALRLDARADDSEHARILARQVPRRRRRHRRRSRLGDVAAVQNRQECSSQRLEEHDGRQMRWQSLRRVGSVDRYQLGAERLRVADVCRHDADQPVLRPDLHDRPEWLLRLTGRELRERGLHSVDQVVHREERADVPFREQ